MLGKTARAVTGASVVAAPTDAATGKTLLTQRKAPQPCQQLNLTCGVGTTAVRQTIEKLWVTWRLTGTSEIVDCGNQARS